jgi:peptidoglycan/xylan/chitin deacetylase (PgdA/CDA1 family)
MEAIAKSQVCKGVAEMDEKPNLWSTNDPAQFWQVTNLVDKELWQDAVCQSLHLDGQLELQDLNQFLHFTLGEGRFGEDHWSLTSINRLYWWLKPSMPPAMIRFLRSRVTKLRRAIAEKYWPIDDRYTLFQWEIMRRFLQTSGLPSVTIRDFWPEKRDFAIVLTHDVESKKSHSFIPVVADLEEKYGFRSLFNIVGDQIPKDKTMLQEMRDRGFEIGLHGYHHDERNYRSRQNFLDSSIHLNNCLKELNAIGYRSPLNLRNPEWMQVLEIDYDLSFFDTDPFEPIPGGTMNIWPFRIGRFIELPATLVQDNTLVNLLGERTPRIWLEKVEFLKRYHGMALLNSHPDYLMNKEVWNVYETFLRTMQERQDYWKALPCEITKWWRLRTEGNGSSKNFPFNMKRISLVDGELVFN